MIHFILKIFAEKQHADSFLRGDMYANRLSWSKGLEDSEGRGDKYEGAAMLQRDNSSLHLTATNKETGEVLGEFIFSGDDFSAPTIMQLAAFDDLNLFCMFAGHSKDFQQETDAPPQELKKHIEIPDHCLQLGRYAVVITDAPEFLRRVKVAADREGYQICCGLVEYYDPEVGTSVEPLSIKTASR